MRKRGADRLTRTPLLIQNLGRVLYGPRCYLVWQVVQIWLAVLLIRRNATLVGP